jgi:hypothetical protein
MVIAMHRQSGGGAVRLLDSTPLEPPVTTEDVSRLLSQLGPVLLEVSRSSEGPHPTLALDSLRRAEALIGAFVRAHST